MIAQAAPREHLQWLEKRTGLALSAHARAIEAVDATGKVRGMIAFDNWAPASVMAHMAVDSPIVWRSLLLPGLSYIFKQRGKSVVIGAIAADNLASLRTADHIGFRVVSRIRDGYSLGVDLIILELRPETCRYMGNA